MLSLAELIDSNTERLVFEEFQDGAEALKEVMMSSLGQEIPVTTVRRQSTGTQESYPSPPPFSAHLLEIVVWISET